MLLRSLLQFLPTEQVSRMSDLARCTAQFRHPSYKNLVLEPLEGRRLLAGDLTFETGDILDTGDVPFDVIAKDLDADGDTDLVVANQCSLDESRPCDGPNFFVSVYRNDGDGSFLSEQYKVDKFPLVVDAADLNADGHLDLVVGRSEGSVSVLLGNADGTFGKANDFAVDIPVGIATGDINGDGKLDVVVSNRDANEILVLVGKGDGTFEKPVDYATGRIPNSIAAGDLDNDGDLDVVTGNGGSRDITVLINRGDGSFESPTSVGRLPGSRDRDVANSVQIADLNHDGHADVIASSARVAVFFGTGDGSGTLARPQTYGTHGNYSDTDFGDVDKDGDFDVVAVEPGGGFISVLLNDGTGSLSEEVKISTERFYRSLTLGDLDGDGDLDLAAANAGTDELLILFNSTEFPARLPAPGDANGDFQFDQNDIILVLEAAKYGTAEAATFAEGDWNGDGLFNQLDIIAALQTGNYLQGPYVARATDTAFANYP